MTPDQSRRAPRMAPDERRAQIIAATIPLLREHGAAVTSRQIAQAAGIAEGTIFRSFEDKDALVDAAIDTVLDPEPGLAELEALDSSRPMEEYLADVVEVLVRRSRTIAEIMQALGGPRHPRRAHHSHAAYVARFVAVLEPYADRLRVSPAAASRLLRSIVMGSVMPFDGQEPIPTAQIVDVVLHGIAVDAVPSR